MEAMCAHTQIYTHTHACMQGARRGNQAARSGSVLAGTDPVHTLLINDLVNH